ncbi:type II secretion system secretin GspD [Bradyrhizobium sp. WYCCWR 13023]|uniref:Type II secretion system secretin GspD n=1 Tax=Bradyrhizobium zhengyangense TaxID=2911009 RepID=A0A9X1RGT0_9BRAD|nr:type II secretion system secretin GspD [Bradyrhizobium zhengyangense]MCG2632361.1 type II secretion system secretin GspD [Bradyrhizobium zhengyangense]
MLVERSRALKIAACLAALLSFSGCAAPGAFDAVTAVHPKLSGQPVSLDTMAYGPMPPSAIPLPSRSSGAVATTEGGDGVMIGPASAPSQTSASAGNVVLNLSSVPVQQAAKTVLGDMVGVNYVVDPRVDGVISVQTTKPVSKADALELFQTALAPIGAVLVQSHGIYRIAPADQGATGAVATGSSTPDVIGGNGVRVVQLKYVAATEIARILEPIVPRGAIVQADDTRNILALKGSPAEIDSMQESIAIFDVDVMRGMSFAVVPVKTPQPDKMVDELKAIFASEREGPLKGRVRFVANSRLGAILVITSQPSYLPRAKEWIRRLDAKANGTERQLHVYQVQNRPAVELATVLQSMFSNEVKVVRPTRSVSPRSTQVGLVGASGKPPGSAAATAGADPQTAAGQTGGSTSDLQSLARALNNEPDVPSETVDSPISASGAAVEPPIRIVADETKNSLLVMANDRDYQRVLRVIQSLDLVASQVLIEAAIAEVTLNDQLQYGLEWQLSKGGAAATFSSATTGAVAAAFPGFNYAVNAANIATTLKALNAITDVNVISTPSLMVLDNKTARLQIGDQVPITTQTATSTVTANTAIVNSISMQDTGVILSVTPRINESGRVQLDIEQEVSAVTKTTTSNIDSPTIQQRRVKTTVVVNDGEVLALGGMIQEQANKTSNQLPLLGDIPGVGALFSNRSDNVKKTELIILITPRVVRDGTESRLATEEYRRKMNVFMPHTSTRARTSINTVQRMLVR